MVLQGLFVFLNVSQKLDIQLQMLIKHMSIWYGVYDGNKDTTFVFLSIKPKRLSSLQAELDYQEKFGWFLFQLLIDKM